MIYQKTGIRRALTRSATIAVVVIAIVVIAGASYTALLLSNNTTTSSSTNSQTTSSSSSSSTTTTQSSLNTSSSTKSQGRIVYESSYYPTSLDPAAWSDIGSSEIQFNVYETLFRFSGNQIIPWLAENYTISPDGLTYTVNLRQGITFEDGSAFNASAVVFSLNRAVLTDSASGNAWMLDGSRAPGLINGSYYFSANLGLGATTYNQSQVNAFVNSKGIAVGSNPYQVMFHLGYVDDSFLAVLSSPITSIVSPTFVIAHWKSPTDGHGFITGATAGETDPWMKTHADGTGPYEVQSWNETISSNVTSNAVLIANPNYWGSPNSTGVAKILEIDLNYVSLDGTRAYDLRTGATDMADISTSDYFQFINQTDWTKSGLVVPTKQFVAVPGPFPEFDVEYIAMNYKIVNPYTGQASAFQPFTNRNFRLAIADAFNITEILDNASLGFGVRANTPVPSGLTGYNSSVPVLYSYNLTNAKGNLTIAAKALGFNSSNPQTFALGYEAGSSLVESEAAIEIATNIDNMGLGITISTSPFALGSFLTTIQSEGYGMFIYNHPENYADPTDFLQTFSSAGYGTNSGLGQDNVGYFTSYNDSNVASLISKQANSSNPATRAVLINQAEVALNQDLAFIWLDYPTAFGIGHSSIGLMMSKSIYGFQSNPSFPGPYFYSLGKS